MICELIVKGIEAQQSLIPEEWNESIVLYLDDEPITIKFNKGKILLEEGENSEASSIIKMTKKQFCEMIDGRIDFMTVWSELAEPSPTDRKLILKGSGAKMITIIDLLSRSYKSNPEFKKLFLDYKNKLESLS